MHRAAALMICLAVCVAVPGSIAAEPSVDTRLGIAEGFRNPQAMVDLHVGWERIVLPWDQIQPDGPDDFSRLGITISSTQLQAELDRGVHVVGLFEFTPGWAAANPEQGKRSAPHNLVAPHDDLSNYWGRFVYETARFYAGRINDWVIWNEPEFKPGDPGAGGSFTWLGTDEEFVQLLKVGYLAVKRANPNANVSFPGTSYWIDVNTGRLQYYERALNIISRDPDAAKYNYFHDVVSFNLYRAADDVFRVHSVIKDIQKRHGIDKPIWLTETNAMPSDDTTIPCPHADTPIQTTMQQQAAYAIQAMAMAAAAGYERSEFYQMLDQDPCAEPAAWGAFRDDGSRRPVADALETFYTTLAGYSNVRFVPYVREVQNWAPWPDEPSSLVPNWEIYQVVFDKPGNERVSVLWNGDGDTQKVRVRKNGSSATLLNRGGGSAPLSEVDGWWVFDLPAATAHYPTDPHGYYFIGGDPLLLFEAGVDPNAAVAAPALGQPGSVAREFKLFPSPIDGQTVGQGEPAEFFVSVRGYEGFGDPVTFNVTQWSSQRVPAAQDPSTLPLQVRLPGPTQPGTTATVRVETAGAEPGIYYLTLQGDGGGQSNNVELALVVN